MNIKQFTLALVCILGFTLFLHGQENRDTLTLVKVLMENGDNAKAAQLLEGWTRNHPKDTDAIWRYAQNQYLLKKFGHSQELFRQALSGEPQNLYLKLDYIESLLNMGRLSKAGQQLNLLSKKEAADPYAQHLWAKWHYWSGNLLTAQQLADKASKNKSVHAPALLKEIKKSRSPVVSIAGAYSTDTQPLDRINTITSLGLARSNLLNLQLNMEYGKILDSEIPASTHLVEIYNKFSISKTGTKINVGGGIFKLNEFDLNALYAITITQRLPDNIQLELSGRHLPYLYTRASIGTTVFTDQLRVTAHWMERHGLEVNTGFQKDIFQDRNEINTAWVWLLSPAIRLKNLTGKIGYTFSFSDSELSMYQAVQTLEQILSSPDPLAQIDGIYNPYFTPNSMYIHAALLSLQLSLGKKMNITLKGNHGFYAHAKNPYLYLNSDQNSAIFIDRGFEKTLFTPFKYEGKLDLELSDRLGLSAAYLYQRIFFYDIQTAIIHLNHYF
jgi:hypothetical protein